MSANTIQLTYERRSFLGRFLRRGNALLGLTLLALLVASALLAPALTSSQPNAVNPLATFQPPGAASPMGTDNLGRDLFTRFLYGARTSLLVGFSASLLGAAIGISLGMAAGYAGGWADSIVAWLVEVLMAFPGVLLALIVVAILGPGIGNVVVAVGISFVPSFTRLTRASVLQVREADYVMASHAFGSSHRDVLLRHITPNIVRPVLTIVTLATGTAILEGAALSFIGLGIQPPDPEWGAMLNAGRSFIGQAWWATVFPGLGIFLTVLSINLISDVFSDIAALKD